MKVNQFVTMSAIQGYMFARFKADVHTYRIMKNGAIQVTYSIVHVKGKLSTFISQKDVAKGTLIVMVQRSKEVTLKPIPGDVVGHAVLNEKGERKYVCNYKFCTCPSFKLNELDKVYGFKICKHSIASSKADRIALNFGQLADVILREQETAKYV